MLCQWNYAKLSNPFPGRGQKDILLAMFLFSEFNFGLSRLYNTVSVNILANTMSKFSLPVNNSPEHHQRLVNIENSY